MVRWLPVLVLVGWLSATACLSAQTQIYTRPVVPAPKDLERLNLEMTWQAALPVDNRGDGVVSLQPIDDQLFIQLHSGPLVVISAKTGELIWKVSLPKKYSPVLPVGVNETTVFVANGPYLYMLDRKTGKQLYMADLPSMAASAPVADVSGVYLALTNNRIVSFGYNTEDIIVGYRKPKYHNRPDFPTGVTTAPVSLDELTTTRNTSPSVTMLRSLKPPFTVTGRDVSPSLAMTPSLLPPYRIETANRSPSISMTMPNTSRLEEMSSVESSDRPRMHWELQATRHMDYSPLLFQDQLIVAGDDRTVFGCRKIAQRVNEITQEYRGDARASAPMSQYGTEFFLAQTDAMLYAFTIEVFRHDDLPVRPLRRFNSNAIIDRKPFVTDDSIYVSSSTGGASRIQRRTFDKVWTNTEVAHVLTTNGNFVYALDRRGDLMILDKARGLKLSTYDVRGFKVLVNEHDDRLYMASNSGLLLSLHDRSYSKPQLQKAKEPKPVVELPKIEEVKKDPPPMKDPPPKKDPPKKDPPKKDPPKKDPPKKDPVPKDEMKKP